MPFTPFFFLATIIFFSLSSCSNAFAAPVAAPTAFDKFMQRATGAGKQTVGFGLDGTPILSPGVPTIDTDGGLPRVDTSGSIRNPSGNPVPVNTTARIPAVEVGKAVGRASVNIGLKLAAVVGVGLTLYDLSKEINFILKRNPDGTIGYDKQDPSVCTVAPCYAYRTGSHSGAPYVQTAEAACRAFAAFKGWFYLSNSETYCSMGTPSNPGGGAGDSITKVSHAPYDPVYFPSTQQELIDAIAAKSGWPSGSAVSRLLAEDAASGAEKLKTGPHTVTGPATSPGTSSQTQKPNGNIETKTVTHNHTYNGNTVTTTTSTVINNYNPTTNITETETTTETPEAERDPDVAVSDTALPDQPKLYTPKYPQGLTGVWAQKKAELVATPLASLVTQLMPSVGSGGSCPAWNLSLNLGAWDYGSHNVAPPCYIWDWCKFFIIAGALLLARALIFGG